MQEKFKEFNKNIGKRLNFYRKSKKISQSELAEILNFSSYVSVSKIERGERALTIDSLLQLESRFEDLDLHWLITGKDSTSAAQAQRKVFQALGASLAGTTEIKEYLQHLIDTAEGILSSGEIKGVLKTQYIQYLEKLRSTMQFFDKQIDNTYKDLASAATTDFREITSAKFPEIC